ncbi:hypothetical protein MP638_001343 [Amoeboaphelidium occidentale]|nr:hypothetical protein MP638_001343 [Amoeboaphelidium occidentale]
MFSAYGFLVGLFIVSQVILWYGVKWILKQMDPLSKKKEESALKAKALFSRLNLKELELNEYEQIIASEIVHPADLEVKFTDIGGLDDILESLQEAVIYPLTMPHLFNQENPLLGPPKGVLLYGPPGVGKTMIAKALAKESGAIFIHLHVSTLTEKWYGESQKLVRAVFSLAKKLQPTIIFIDEIDSFLRERASSDHEVTGMMKAEFMSLWDGLGSSLSDRILILGATNRYADIDKAILRRMPKRFAIKLPDEQQRTKILTLLLKGSRIDHPSKTIAKLARATGGYSGSDLKELCRNAAMVPVREHFKTLKRSSSELEKPSDELRPLKFSDFFETATNRNIKHEEVE